MDADVPDSGDLTHILGAVNSGDESARERLFLAVYEELRAMAARLMDRERPDHTLQPTALVNEACLKLCGGQALRELPNRGHFFGAASRAMFEILVDHARRREAAKRGGAWRRTPLLDHWLGEFERQDLDILAVREALERLATFHERQSRVVSLRFVLGMSHAEIAELLGVSVGTVEGDWRIARAWLRRELGAADR